MGIAALSLSSSGVTWYDFTDPAEPIAVAHIDISEVEDTYTLGARRIAQLSDGITYILEDYTENWFNYHAVQLVDPPAAATVTNCDEESDEDVWQAVALTLLAFAILGFCGTCFFFYKYNKEQAFKFGQMKDFVESEMTKQGAGGGAMSP